MKNGLVLLAFCLVSLSANGDEDRLAARCALKGRNLEIEAASPKGQRLVLRLADYAALRGNSTLNWAIEPGSASQALYLDDLGFSWAPKAGSTPSGRCTAALRQQTTELRLDVTCEALRSEDDSLPGFLNVPAWRLSCAQP